MRAQAAATEAEVAAALDEVLGRRSQEAPNLLDELRKWFTERLGFDLSSGTWEALYWIFLVVLVVFGVTFFRRYAAAARVGRLHRTQASLAQGPSVAERVAALRREALEARERGDLRLALRKHFFALVLGLGSRGDLEFRDAWTNRELVARGKPSPAVEAILGPLVRELEGKEYGHEPVGPGDLDRLEALCRKYLGQTA